MLTFPVHHHLYMAMMISILAHVWIQEFQGKAYFTGINIESFSVRLDPDLYGKRVFWCFFFFRLFQVSIFTDSTKKYFVWIWLLLIIMFMNQMGCESVTT
ncbi:hypothetical protein L1887_34537 [Cichorium endivia]|nr:hypothetical protein L1887_34537 [Cichorium endivia]